MSDAASASQPAGASNDSQPPSSAPAAASSTSASSSSAAARRSLLDALHAGVSPLLTSPRLPRGSLRLHALFSAPKPALELFPFAHVAGSTSTQAGAAAGTGVGAPLEARVEHVFCTAAWCDEEADEVFAPATDGETQGSGGESQASMGPPSTGTSSASDGARGSATAAGPGGRTSRLIYALECFLYTIPATRAAILYVSKLDSSGWAPEVVPAAIVPFLPAPAAPAAQGASLARAITVGFLRHFASLEHWRGAGTEALAVDHCSIHVLARAQPAYLFPSSPENPAKHVLSDGKLIAWWRGVLSDVASLEQQGKAKARNYYVVPGYDERMSTELLPLPPREGDSALARARWVYGHPYSRHLASAPPLPLHRPHLTPSGIDFSTGGGGASAAGAIATLMPHFPDDPKSRFIAEIARDAHEMHAPGTQTQSTSAESQSTETEPEAKRQRLDGPGETTSSAAASQSADEPASQATSTSTSSGSQSTRVSSSVRKLQRERAALDAVAPDEFWERMGFRQECCAGNAVGVFVCIYDAAAGAAEAATAEKEGASSPTPTPTTMVPQRMALAQTTLPDLIRRHLMRDVCDWSSRAGSAVLTRQWNEGVRRAILRKGGLGVSVSEAAQADERLGEGVVWMDVRVEGSSREEREEASRKWEEAGKPMPPTTSREPPKQVNALSVKRKKRPPPP